MTKSITFRGAVLYSNRSKSFLPIDSKQCNLGWIVSHNLMRTISSKVVRHLYDAFKSWVLYHINFVVLYRLLKKLKSCTKFSMSSNS